jgi:hypothetical protein
LQRFRELYPKVTAHLTPQEEQVLQIAPPAVARIYLHCLARVSDRPAVTEKAIEILCAALHQARFLSCAHLAQVVREACEEYDAPQELRDAIEAELGVGLDRPTSADEAKLARQGLLP